MMSVVGMLWQLTSIRYRPSEVRARNFNNFIGFSAYLPARMGPLILLQRSVSCLVSPAHRGLLC
jgi:hypothetical protein